MPRFLPVANPQNRFSSTRMEYDEGEEPGAELEVREDQSRSILSANDSPDVGFRWSVNPYRGCFHACAYCMSGDTRILMADGATRALCDIRVGDEIYGTRSDGRCRRFAKTRVSAHWETFKRPALRIQLVNGTTLVASRDHRFLTSEGWRTAERLRSGSRLLGASGEPVEGAAAAPVDAFRIEAVVALGTSMSMFDITTGTSDFIANGVVSHNCYARPSHEYLSLGAGSDFSRKIVIKPNAPQLLREAFEKKTWKGEVIVFSGITDCYQPLESKLRLTRQCLEVCAEYKNPVGIITKSPVIERDVDILQELARVAGVRATVSVPFWDPDVAKALEPMVTTPERRMKIVETLAKAGINVGVSVSPIVPGLNDDHLGDVLERASAAGAHHAFYVLLRLPGAVREVFETAMRKHLPLRAEKVFRRLREAHGGKMYDASFGMRGRGEGVYADTIRMLFERTATRVGLNPDEMTWYTTPNTFARPVIAKKGSQTSFGF